MTARKLILPLVALLVALGPVAGREKKGRPQFKYAGGTENLSEACAGSLELDSTALTFRCTSGSVAVSYSSVTLMQFRSDVAKKVRKLKVPWKVRPPVGGGKTNRYFTVLFQDNGATHVIVLKVAPQSMRPYLAQIDLRTGKRVEVQSHEEYE